MMDQATVQQPAPLSVDSIPHSRPAVKQAATELQGLTVLDLDEDTQVIMLTIRKQREPGAESRLEEFLREAARQDEEGGWWCGRDCHCLGRCDES